MIAEHVDTAVTVWSKRLALILLGWMAGSAYHGTSVLTQKAVKLETVQRVEIPKLKAAVRCEDARGDKATVVAKQAIKGAVLENERIPDAKELPADNCAHPTGK